MKTTTLTLAALFTAIKLMALTPYYLDSQPGAPYPMNPCLTCDTSTNEDGSIQVHDPMPEQSFSTFSYESNEETSTDPYVVVTIHLNLPRTDPTDDYLNTNGYGNTYALLYDSYEGWDTVTNLVNTYPMSVGASLTTGGTIDVSMLWPTLTCYDLVEVDVTGYHSDGSLAHMKGFLQMEAQKTSINFSWAFSFDDTDHTVRGLSMGLAPNSYGGFMSMGRTQVIAEMDHPDGERPLVCTPQNPPQLIGPSGEVLTGAWTLIAVGGYQPDTVYQIVKTTNLASPDWKFEEVMECNFLGYGYNWVTNYPGNAFFKVIPLP